MVSRMALMFAHPTTLTYNCSSQVMLPLLSCFRDTRSYSPSVCPCRAAHFWVPQSHRQKKKEENNHHKIHWWNLCGFAGAMYAPLKHVIKTSNKILYTRLFEPKVLTEKVHIMDTLYEVLISTCKKHLQKFTLHKQTCNLNQKMQHILIQNIKVDYKNNVTCPPLAFSALLSIS